MNKKVHGCKQVQFTDIFQNVSSLFITIEPRQENKDSWKSFVN